LTVARLQHASIVPVYAAGIEKGVPYLAMELAEGTTLSDILRHFRLSHCLSSTGATSSNPVELAIDPGGWTTSLPNGGGTTILEGGELGSAGNPLEAYSRPPDGLLGKTYWLDLARAFAGVAEGLQYAHSQGVIHRDIKPSNLILGRDGRLRILDFGVARADSEPSLTRTDERVGTLLYMSPEQAQGQEVEAPSDIFSLGATLYEMLVWRPPSSGTTSQEIVRSIIERDPPLPRSLARSVPRPLETIVMKCLRKNPERRFGTAEALAQDLRRFARGDPIEAEPEAWGERLARRAWQRRGLFVQCSAVLSLLIAAVVLAFQSHDAAQQRELEAYNESVRQGVMSLLEAQHLGPAPPLERVGGEAVSVLHAGDTPSRGSGVQGKRGVSSRSSLLQTGPRLFRAGPEPIGEAVQHLEAAIRRLPAQPIAHYHLARALIFRGERQAAEERLERVLELDSRFLPAMSLLAWLLERREPRRAWLLRSQVERQAALEGSRWSPAWFAAQRAVLEKQWLEADAMFDSLGATAALGPELYAGDSIDTFLQRGVTRLKVGRAIEALPDFGAAAQALSGRLEPRLFIARALHQAGRKAAAEKELARLHAEAQRKDDLAAKVVLAAAAHCRERGDHEAAISWIRKLSGRFRTIALIHLADLFSLKGEHEEALKAAQEAREQDRRDPEVAILLGSLFLERGETLEASRWYEEASRLAPRDPRPLVAQATCFELAGRLSAAREKLEEAIGLHAAFAPAHGELGRIRHRLGDAEGAIASYDIALELDPGDPFTANNLGTLLDGRGDRASARRYFERALELAPALAHAHYNLGWLFQRERRYAEARERYEAALEHGLDDGLVYSGLGACLHFLRDLDGALEAYEAALARGQDDSALYHNYATVLSATGRYPEAVNNFEEAIAREPHGLYSYLYLARAWEKMGELEKAVEANHRALKQDPTFRPAQEELAGLLLRLGKLPAEADELEAEIVRMEATEPGRGSGGPISWLLSRYRRALAPRLASYASIDDLFAPRELLLHEGSQWRFLLGPVPPAEGWTDRGFEDAAWREGEAPFASPGSGISLFLRASFDVADPLAVDGLVLKVQGRAAFAAYLNGLEVHRRGLVEKEAALEAAAERAYDAWRVEEIPLDPRALAAGRNIIALRAVSAAEGEEMVARIELEASPGERSAIFERVERAYADFLAVSQAGDEALRLYFEGRRRELSGEPAAAFFERVIERDGSRPEPYLRLAESLAASGEHETALSVIEEALEAGLTGHDALWELWLRLRLVDLAQDPGEVLAAHLRLAPEEVSVSRRQLHVRWLLERLARREPLRINCGGQDGKALDVSWSRDRFFLGGDDRVYFEKLDVEKHAIEPLLDRTERYFYESQLRLRAYRIPLPAGRYRVCLRFTEGFFEEAGNRRFDVLVEGQVLLEGYEPRFGVAEVYCRDLEIGDGALEIDFRRLKQNPKLSAFEVVPLD
jgi:tetratricopeptide (TPR) repeat protein